MIKKCKPFIISFYVVAVIAMIFAVKIIFWFRKNSKRIYALYLLKKNASENSASAAVKMSELLRRICISRYPEAVSYSGKNWIDFLNNHAKQKL